MVAVVVVYRHHGRGYGFRHRRNHWSDRRWGGERGLLPNLALAVLYRISAHEDDPLSIFFLVNIFGIEIWSLFDPIRKIRSKTN